ncbi:hypothetical protein [Pedobacter sp. JY14-1]|uniref:hypothetical protein n=1 Tax=Pedobacter sp. JY14-1 TaxID=3034151 RepID=UPI0023E30753|nr:hypothetical protein [Pedobacter sp. JY14-1]
MDFKENSNESLVPETKIADEADKNPVDTDICPIAMDKDENGFFLESLNGYPAWRMWR